MSIGERAKQRMDEIGMSQEALARAVGISQPAIFKLLAGKTLRSTRLAEIAAALGVRPQWLANGELPKQEIAHKPVERVAESHPQWGQRKEAATSQKKAYRTTSRLDEHVLSMLPPRYRTFLENLEWLTDKEQTDVMREILKRRNKKISRS